MYRSSWVDEGDVGRLAERAARRVKLGGPLLATPGGPGVESSVDGELAGVDRNLGAGRERSVITTTSTASPLEALRLQTQRGAHAGHARRTHRAQREDAAERALAPASEARCLVALEPAEVAGDPLAVVEVRDAVLAREVETAPPTTTRPSD